MTVAIVRGDPELALAGGSGPALAAELAAGALLLAAALLVRRSGALFPWLLVAAALAWPLAEWNTPAAGAAFTAGLVLYAAWPPLLTAAALRGPDERRFDRPAVVVLVLAFAVSVGVLGIASTVLFDPRAEGCLECPANRLLVADAESARSRARPVGPRAQRRRGRRASPRSPSPGSRGPRPRAGGSRRPCWSPASRPWRSSRPTRCTGCERGFLSNDTTDRALWKGADRGARPGRGGCGVGTRSRAPHAGGAGPARGRARRIAAARRPAGAARDGARRPVAASCSTASTTACAGSTRTAAPRR